MKSIKQYINGYTCLLAIAVISLSSCKKDGNPNDLPEVSTESYEGKIDGFNNSDEVFAENLVAYWSFDGTKNELKSSTAPTATANDAFVPDGIKGQAIRLTSGYLFFGTQFEKFKTDVFKSFSISAWIQILNNGSKRTMLFQLARPGVFNGNINFALNTNAFPASDVDNLKIQPTFSTVGGGTQDNVNAKRDNPGDANYFPYLTPKIGANKWTHVILTYSGTTGVFNIWADGIKIGAYPNRGTAANNLFKSYEPSQVIIGGNYNVIPGMAVNADANFAAMTGNIDELRVYNISLPDAHVKALYNLGLAHK
jgi:hypothetical protein